MTTQPDVPTYFPAFVGDDVDLQERWRQSVRVAEEVTSEKDGSRAVWFASRTIFNSEIPT